MKRTTVSERALILAPHGRDASLAVGMLGEAGISADACTSLPHLVQELERGAAVVVVAEEALISADLGPVATWIAEQEEWSDLPFVLLTSHGGGVERNPAARRYLDVLGNVTFVERPFHPTTLISGIVSALRGRRRQYEARARLEALRESERRLAFLDRLGAETAPLADADAVLATTTRLLGEHLKLSVCAYADMDDDQDGFTIRGDWAAPGSRSIVGHYSLADFGKAAVKNLSAGLPLLVNDNLRELAPQEAATFQNIGITATICMPLVKEGRLTALMAIHDRMPRLWTEAELNLLREVTARSWAHVERVATIVELRESEARLRALNADLERRVTARALGRSRTWQLSPEIMGVVNADGYFEQTNPAWGEVLGWSETEISSRPFFDFIHAEDLPKTVAVWAAAIERGEPALRFENRYRTKVGNWRWLSWVAVPDDGKVYCSARDITDEKEREAELEAAHEQLRQAQKMEAVGQLTGGVAHDFNNLLTIIKSSTELLRRTGVAEERRARYVEAISETVDRASKLTGQLLAFARRQSLKPEVFNVADRIQAITEMLGTIVGPRIPIIADVSDEPCFVETDVSQFETALVNMAVNARDAMDGEGTLKIKVCQASNVPVIRSHNAKQGGYVCVTMSDTGSGIPSDKLTQIFEPFFTTKEVGKGTGLGLSQVFGFTKQSGGDVSVESILGVGTTFTLYLPRVEAVAEQERPAHRNGTAQPATSVGRPRVLLVEDNVEVGNFSTQLLQDLGYETTWAANADEALKLIAEVDAFDVVFSDVIMPGMSGIELGHEIQLRYPGLPVVLTSGYSHVLAEEGRHGFELLHKPYAADELSRILAQVTRET